MFAVNQNIGVADLHDDRQFGGALIILSGIVFFVLKFYKGSADVNARFRHSKCIFAIFGSDGNCFVVFIGYGNSLDFVAACRFGGNGDDGACLCHSIVAQ